MPPNIPARTRRVFCVGAGLSSVAGLRNTPSLLQGILELAGRFRWLQSQRLPRRLQDAIEYFYPDGAIQGYQPDVVDFFSALKSYTDFGAGLAGGFKDAPSLYRDLKFAIAHLLVERIRGVDQALSHSHPYFDDLVQPGNIIITSNWDVVIERLAQIKDIPVRLSGNAESGLVLLKLHGSIDWCLARHRTTYPDGDYASLVEALFGARRRQRVPQARDALIRVRALESWSDAWRMVKSRSEEPFLVTMARGKSGDLGPLLGIWKDAYAALSRAETLEIVGYSMPPDDIEIRTLLRAGVRRADGPNTITVRNPSPEVHERLRRYLARDLVSEYMAVDSLT
jgi:hypothetical protein